MYVYCVSYRRSFPFYSQLESRDREIVRLTQLINGGDARSTIALGRDCCFRGVSTLTADVRTLQQHKLQLQHTLQQAVAEQTEAKQRACRLADDNKRLEAECERLRKRAASGHGSLITALSSKATMERECDVQRVRDELQASQAECATLKRHVEESAGRSKCAGDGRLTVFGQLL